MKKLLLTVFLLIPLGAQADQCIAHYTFGGNVMKARQDDVPVEYFHKAIKELDGSKKKKETARVIVKMAYEYPILFRQSHKDELIATFAEAVYKACDKGGYRE